MTRINAIFFFAFFCISFSVRAQSDKCGINQLDSLKQANVPEYLHLKNIFFQKVQAFKSNAKISAEVIKIPVVVHIIHNDSSHTISDDPAKGNISIQQVESQIIVLNEDFRRLLGTPGFNDHPDGADMEIEFCLANLDPDGMPTNGITRHYIDKDSYSLSDDPFIKGVEHWPPQNYLNIYTVPRLNNNFLGYANFPFESEINPQLDGVVIANRFFGDLVGSAKFGVPYDRGRTLTHEIGHWLGLRHTWGDGGCGVDDGCFDTPQSSSGNVRCDTTATAFKCGSQDMVRNYMDYSDDLCFNIFTKCQRDMARSVFNQPFPLGKREFLELNGQLCGNTPIQPKMANNNILTIDRHNAKYALANLPINEVHEILVYDMQGRLVKNEKILVDAGGLLNFNLSDQRAGIYILNLKYASGSNKRFKIYGPLR